MARSVVDGINELSLRYDGFMEQLMELGRIEANRPQGKLAEEWSSGQQMMLIAEELKRLSHFKRSYSSQLEASFIEPLDSLRTDLQTSRELRKRWEKNGADYLHEVGKFMGRKNKESSIQESADEVAATHRSYHEASLDFVGRVNELMQKEQVRIQDALLCLAQCQVLRLSKEREALSSLEPTLKQLEAKRDANKIKMNKWMMENLNGREEWVRRCFPFYNPLHSPPPSPLTNLPLTKSGYLWKRSSHPVRPVWSRRFFWLHDNVLEYFSQDPKVDSSSS